MAYPGFQRGGCLRSGPIRKVGEGGGVSASGPIYEKWGGGGGGAFRFRSDTFVPLFGTQKISTCTYLRAT